MKKNESLIDKAGELAGKAGQYVETVRSKTNEYADKFEGLTAKLRHSSDPESDVAGHELRDVDQRETDFDPTIQHTDGRN